MLCRRWWQACNKLVKCQRRQQQRQTLHVVAYVLLLRIWSYSSQFESLLLLLFSTVHLLHSHISPAASSFI